MAEAIKPPPMTEPVVVQCVLAEGLITEVKREIIRLVFFAEMETVELDMAPERRIVARIAITPGVARKIVRDLRTALDRDNH